LGGSGEDSATGVAIDATGTVYVTGATASVDFPRSIGEGSDFIVRLNSVGSALDYVARFPSGIASHAMAVELSGRIHIAGTGAVVSTITPGLMLGARIYGVSNVADRVSTGGGNISGRVDAGEVISIYGTGLSSATPRSAMLDGSGRVSTTLGGVR